VNKNSLFIRARARARVYAYICKERILISQRL